MPHTRSAKKRLRQNERRRLKNRSVKRTLKTHLKRVADAIEDYQHDKEHESEDFDAQASLKLINDEFNLVTKKLDKAAGKRIIHPNKAARIKSRLAKQIHVVSQENQSE